MRDTLRRSRYISLRGCNRRDKKVDRVDIHKRAPRCAAISDPRARFVNCSRRILLLLAGKDVSGVSFRNKLSVNIPPPGLVFNCAHARANNRSISLLPASRLSSSCISRGPMSAHEISGEQKSSELCPFFASKFNSFFRKKNKNNINQPSISPSVHR